MPSSHLIDSIHIGPVRPGQRVHNVRVAILGGKHQCRPAHLYRQHPHWPRASRPARSQCPCGHSWRHTSMPSSHSIDSIHIGPVRPGQRVHSGRVAIPGGKHQCRPAISIDSIHIGPVRPGQRVHSGRVAFEAASINAVMPSLSTASTLAPCVPASAFTMSVWPFMAASINAVLPSFIDSIHIGPVRPDQRGYQGQSPYPRRNAPTRQAPTVVPSMFSTPTCRIVRNTCAPRTALR